MLVAVDGEVARVALLAKVECKAQVHVDVTLVTSVALQLRQFSFFPSRRENQGIAHGVRFSTAKRPPPLGTYTSISPSHFGSNGRNHREAGLVPA